MKTLIFCTAFASSPKDWDERHSLWLKYLKLSGLRYDQILLVDDASASIPKWPDVEIAREADGITAASLKSSSPVIFYTHTDRLGRQDVFEFPGWWRSFSFGVRYGEANGFEKIIHIESDAFLLSNTSVSYFNNFSDGWFSMFCLKYQFPEIAIQGAAGRSIKSLIDFVAQPYSRISGKLHETAFPFTHVEKVFVGDRFGEKEAVVPKHADYVAQTLQAAHHGYYWWINEPADRSATRSTYICSSSIIEMTAPFSDASLGGSWCGSETTRRWMTGQDSSLHFSPVDGKHGHLIELGLEPCILENIKFQRLMIIINNLVVNDLCLYRSSTVCCWAPAGLLNDSQRNEIRFIHPDSINPSHFGYAEEVRQLSVALNSFVVRRAYIRN